MAAGVTRVSKGGPRESTTETEAAVFCDLISEVAPHHDRLFCLSEANYSVQLTLRGDYTGVNARRRSSIAGDLHTWAGCGEGLGERGTLSFHSLRILSS